MPLTSLSAQHVDVGRKSLVRFCFTVVSFFEDQFSYTLRFISSLPLLKSSSMMETFIQPKSLLMPLSVCVLMTLIYAYLSTTKRKRIAKSEFERDAQHKELSVSKLMEDGIVVQETTDENIISVAKGGKGFEMLTSISPDENFDLEKRAIFSKVWMCVSHVGRFTKPGDYHSVDFAGFSIFVILGKDHVLRAFHNVCRHRAYPVLRKSHGSSLVLGCKYHGWSYSSKGELTKAPQFENVEGFDKSQNGLFEIHSTVSDDGFVFVNLDGSKHVLAPDFRDLDDFANNWNISKHSRWVMGWAEEIPVDWKISLNIGTADKPGVFEQLQQLMIRRNASSQAKELNSFPGTIIKPLASGSWAAISLFPIGARLTSVRCDVYTTTVESEAVTEKSKALAKTAIKSFISTLKANGENAEELYETVLSSDTKYRFQPLLDLQRALEGEKKIKVDPSRRHEIGTDGDIDAVIGENAHFVCDNCTMARWWGNSSSY